jgi:hypothetical protein
LSFQGPSAVVYRVYTLEVSGDEGEWVIERRKPVTTVTATSDSSGHVSLEELVRVLKNAGFRVSTRGPDRVWFGGKTDGTITVYDADDYPLLELQYLRHHKLVPVRPMLSLVDPKTWSDENPLSTESIVLIGLGIVAAGALGYWLYTLQSQAAEPATAPPQPSSSQPQPQPESSQNDENSIGGQIGQWIVGAPLAVLTGGQVPLQGQSP